MKNEILAELTDRLDKCEAIIGVVGLGYVGLPLIIRYSEVGYKTIGFDIDSVQIKQLNNGESYIEHIPYEKIVNSLERGFVATDNFSRIVECDAIIICVPTPLNKHREPDLSFVVNTMDELIPYLRKGQVISLESTTYPGTTEEEIFPKIKSAGFEVGKDFALVYSPEREDPGNPNFLTQNIPKVCGGHTNSCLGVGVSLYKNIIDKIIQVSSTKTAEMTKLLENIYRAVNIGLVNEMKVVADKMGIDIHEVIEAAATKPFGFTAYYPGPGLGGHCIPIDPFYLTWKARAYGVHTRFIELAGEVNAAMPDWVVAKLIDALNEKNKPLKGSKILILGIAYKKNVDDMRESPAVDIMESLRTKGATIEYSDPHVPIFPKLRDHCFDLRSNDLLAEIISSFDAVVLATDHDQFDYDFILKHSKLIIDSRGRYRKLSDKVIKA